MRSVVKAAQLSSPLEFRWPHYARRVVFCLSITIAYHALVNKDDYFQSILARSASAVTPSEKSYVHYELPNASIINSVPCPKPLKGTQKRKLACFCPKMNNSPRKTVRDRTSVN